MSIQTIGEAQAHFERTGHGLYGDADNREVVKDTGRYESLHQEYDAVAVQAEINKDRRIGGREARMIHAVLRGRS